MILNLMVVSLIALFMAYIFERLRLPQLLGMLFTGIFLGPYMKDIFFNTFSLSESFLLNNIFISDKLIELSGELRILALIIILIRAGLGINKEILNKVGKIAFKMSFIPGVFEAVFIMTASTLLLHLPIFEAGTLAFIIAAVSPAVVVPQMLNLKEKGYGQKKEIPTLILAGASIDDVVAITFFGVFLNLALGKDQNILMAILDIPLSILLGILFGGIIGFIFVYFFKKHRGIRDTKKLIIFIAIALLFHELEDFMPIASLIGIMTIGFVILEKYEGLAKRLAERFNRIWVFAEIILFVLIGATVNIGEIFNSGFFGLCIILVGLVGRSIGVMISLHNSGLNHKEKIFCTVAYLPKATVQAAIGAVPLSMGLASGNIILAIAVLSIIVTAPLGALGINYLAPKYLET